MAVNYEPVHLSAAPNGGVLDVPLSSFVTVHTAPNQTNIYDELYINVFYVGTSATGEVIVRLNTTDPNLEMTFHVVSGTVTPIFRGHRISNGATVAIRGNTSGRYLCFGSVNRITLN